MSIQDISGLYNALAHGDDDHKAWLLEAIQAYSNGTPIPSPRGSGNKEARIYELEEQVRQLKEKYEK